MAKFPISLGQKMNGGALPYSEPAKPDKELYYPTLHIDRVEGLELPEEGTITFRYRTCRDTTETAKDGEKTKSFALDILEVVSAKASPVENDDEESASDALDKLREEAEGESE